MRSRHFSLRDPLVKILAIVFLVVAAAFLGVFSYFYVKYERVVDRRMAGGIFSNAAKVYARPRVVQVGDKMSATDIAADLRHAGYAEGGRDTDGIGHYRFMGSGLQIDPGAQSFHASDGAVIRFQGGKVSSITETGDKGQTLEAYELEPQLVTALFEGQDRTKRELIKFEDIPPVLVNAVLAIEDRRFFQHGGVNYFRLMEAALIDLREGRHGQGGSTITMQLSRGFFLTPEKTIKRKLTEMLIAIELEQKFSKQRIFQMYANQVYLGQRGSFSINGFGEASHAYFNKDMKNLTLPEAALLAGMIQRPNYLSPYRHPERALERRNLVLDSMVETGAITRDEAERAKATPLKLAAPNVEASDAPYFVDLVKDQLSPPVQRRRAEQPCDAYLHHHRSRLAACGCRGGGCRHEAGGRAGGEAAYPQGESRPWQGSRRSEGVEPGPLPQVALVALDPHTGEVLALVGGRNYGMSQFDHAIAKRPDGIDLQALRVCCGGQYGRSVAETLSAAHADPDNGVVTESSGVFHARQPGRRFAGEHRQRRPGLRAAKLSRDVSRRSHGALRAGAVAEQRNGATGAGGRLRQGGGAWPRRRESPACGPLRPSRWAPTMRLRSKWPELTRSLPMAAHGSRR